MFRSTRSIAGLAALLNSNRHMFLGFSLLLSCLTTTMAEAQTFTGRLFSRAQNFAFQCNGQNQVVPLVTLQQFPTSPANIVGGEISLFENHGGLQYVRANATFTGDLLVSLAISDNRVTNFFPQGVFQLPVNGGVGGFVSLPPDQWRV